MKKIIVNDNSGGENVNAVREIAVALGISYETASIMYSRGIDTVEKADKFLHPGKDNFIDPYLLKGVNEAVERIRKARDNGEAVLVYGDYDADGISASAILYRALKEFGIEPLVTVPEREEGYGLNEEIIEYFATERFVDLIITVDCGISDCDQVEYIKDLGIDVIVTDHHEVPDILPDCTIINPKLKDQEYGFDALCGAGVAYKLAYALIGGDADKYLDYVALATIADSMVLTGENRDLVCEGLKLFNGNKVRSAFKNLLASVSAKDVTAQTLAFSVAPKINAAGRMGDAKAALSLFISEDEGEIFELSAKLIQYNLERQEECDKLYRSAKSLLSKEGATGRIILLKNDNWKTGFIGIVAARLVEEYARPVIIFANNKDSLKGSARSVDGINIYEAIASAKDILVEFGGHSQAAGVTVKEENFEELKKRLDDYLTKNYDKEAFIPKISVERKITERFPFSFARELNLLEPFGVGNKKPLFLTEVSYADAAALKSGSLHVSFSTDAMEMLYFNGADSLQVLNTSAKKQIIFEPNLSYFNRQESLKGYVKDIIISSEDISLVSPYAVERQLKNLTVNAFNKRVVSLTKRQIDEIIANDKGDYGTAYLLNDADNIKLYPSLKELGIGLFRPGEKNLMNTVIIAPDDEADLTGFNRVIYLDKPIQPINVSDKTEMIICEDVIGYGWVDKISTDRQAFADSFREIRRLVGRKYRGSAALYEKNSPDIDEVQFILSLEVFSELKIFNVENGILSENKNVKADLNDSAILNKIRKC